MKIFVISLPEAKARRALIHEQMTAAGLAYSIIDGIRPTATQIQSSGYSEHRRLVRYGYGLSTGEVGCFLAHQAAWKLVRMQNEKCLILEDDAMVSGLTPSLLECLRHSPYRLIRLAGTFKKRHKFIGKTTYAKYWGDPAGTVAYVVAPQEAEKLLEKSSSFYMAVDDFMEARQLHGVHTYARLPYPVRHSGEDSHINDRNRPSLSVAVRLRRMLVRIPIDINKYLHRLAYYVL
ncbi:MAG: hypothetical protein JWR60_1842 [Polaromonas sp.]|nr:hypothetical protein [Polaromonas sp.]